MSSWTSYPKIYNLGHPAIADLFADPVIVEEKVDGSQFSFGMIFDAQENVHRLRVRSRGAELNIEAPDKMFAAGVAVAQELAPILAPGWTYRCEYLAKPKHNTLAYDRIPAKHLILFDVATGPEEYLSRRGKEEAAASLGLEVVPLIFDDSVDGFDVFRSFLGRTSILGGQKIEGVVVKNYVRFGRDAKPLMGKFVSESFREAHGADWKERHPGYKDIVQRIVEKYRTPARWMKAVQHLREAGALLDDPKDIGNLFREVHRDFDEECREAATATLYGWAEANIKRGVTAGLAEWYKDELLKKQFSVYVPVDEE